VDSLKQDLLAVAMIVVVAIAELVAAQIARRRILRAIRQQERLGHDRRQQVVTVIELAFWGVTVVIAGAAVLMLLSRFDINITPLLASAGVAGLAMGLGAQTLIKDLIGGFFIVAENQYVVGDTIQVGALSGQVERLTLRATNLRDENGRLHIIPNGEARIVSNLTKEWSRAVVDVSVAYEEDLERVLRVLEETAEALAQDAACGPLLLEAPQVLGPMSLDDRAVSVRVMVKTRPGQQWEVGRELRKRILATCEREGIAPAYPRREVWVHDWQKGQPGRAMPGQEQTEERTDDDGRVENETDRAECR